MTDSRKESTDIIRRGGKALSWGTLGEVVGRIVAVYISDGVIDDATFAHGMAALFAIVGSLNLSQYFAKDTSDPIYQVRKCLQGADKLFIDGIITQPEFMEMRKACLGKNKNNLTDG